MKKQNTQTQTPNRAGSGVQYRPTIDASGFSAPQFKALHVGQWVTVFGARGQYLGVSRAGTVVVNYKTSQGERMRDHMRANKPLRQFARIKGTI